MKGLLFIGICAILPLLFSACGSPYGGDEAQVEPESGLKAKVMVEAYLFDAKLRRDNKPTSVRLEFFHTDSIIAIAGRGYLGKGALRGRLSEDTLEVYFPATDEYLYEPVATVLGSVKCSGELPRISLLGLFNNLPDSVLTRTGLVIESDYNDRVHPEFHISAKNCPWVIHLTYALQKEGWRITAFEFDDGEGNTLKGKRRTYKRDAEVKAGKFHVPIKPGSLRIIL